MLSSTKDVLQKYSKYTPDLKCLKSIFQKMIDRARWLLGLKFEMHCKHPVEILFRVLHFPFVFILLHTAVEYQSFETSARARLEL